MAALYDSSASCPADLHQDLRPRSSATLCKAFPDSYWRDLDAARRLSRRLSCGALTDAGYLAALIPEEYGGSGLGVHRSVDHPRRSQSQRRQCPGRATRRCTRWARCCAMGPRAQKRARSCRHIASGALRLQAFGVTEPTTGSDTTQLKTDGHEKKATGT